MIRASKANRRSIVAIWNNPDIYVIVMNRSRAGLILPQGSRMHRYRADGKYLTSYSHGVIGHKHSLQRPRWQLALSRVKMHFCTTPSTGHHFTTKNIGSTVPGFDGFVNLILRILGQIWKADPLKDTFLDRG